jgi:purine-nucleoside phosphorylase
MTQDGLGRPSYDNMDAEISAAALAIRSRWDHEPQVGLVLGTGLGGLTEAMRVDAEIPYQHIPHFPRSTAMAHKGSLYCGELGGVPLLVMAGRCHLYEGYPLAHIQFPIRVMHALGIRTLLLTNAVGGLNPRFEPGDVMVMEGHVDLMGCGVGFQPAQKPEPRIALGRLEACPTYCPSLRTSALAAARTGNFPCQRGVYVGVKGPNYETRAEYRAFRRLGGDAVGMSTIPEVLAASSLGMRVLGLSTITNVARPDAPQIVTSDEVVEVAKIAVPKLQTIVSGVLTELTCDTAETARHGDNIRDSAAV